MNSQKTNSKALNLDGIKDSKNKVTIGFKADPDIKLSLANEAEKLGLTLSEHVECLIGNREKSKSNSKEQAGEIEKLSATVNEQKKTIDFYENDLLKKLYEENKDKKIIFKNKKGEPVEIQVVDLKDIYTIIINSFKTVKNA